MCPEKGCSGSRSIPKVLKEAAHSIQREGERGNRMEQSGGFSGWWQEDQLRACGKELYQGHSSGNEEKKFANIHKVELIGFSDRLCLRARETEMLRMTSRFLAWMAGALAAMQDDKLGLGETSNSVWAIGR